MPNASMTLNVETPRVVYTGSGTRGPFSLSVSGTPITYSASSHIIAERYSEDGVLIETLVEGTDYDLSATSRATGDSAATLTIDPAADALATDEKLVIYRQSPLSQTLALTQGGGFSSSANEANYDKIVRILQELYLSFGRQITINPISSGVDVNLPVPQAGYVLGWNEGEDGLVNLAALSTDTVTVSAAWAAVINKSTIALGLTQAGFSSFVQTLLDDTDASAFLTTLGVSTFIKTLLDDADAAAARTTLGAQTLDATLTAMAALTIADNTLIRGTGADTFEAIVSTPVAQRVNTQTGAVATGTTVMPADDTIPQNTEGVEFITLAITPKNVSNILIVEAELHVAGSTASFAVMALFQDSTANALDVDMVYVPAAGAGGTAKIRYTMTAGTTSATTFKIRAGLDRAGTLTVNGSTGARLFGGLFLSKLTITELWA